MKIWKTKTHLEDFIANAEVHVALALRELSPIEEKKRVKSKGRGVEEIYYHYFDI